MRPNNDADEVVDDVHADDRNICKAIAFRLWNIPQKVSLLPFCGISGKRVGLRYFLCVWLFDQIAMSQSINLIVTAINQSINLSSKTGYWVGYIFSKKEKKSLICICKWKGPFRFANKTKWTSVKMSRTIGPIVHSSIQPFHRFKILLDKKKLVCYLEVF